jgi:hypothetical protein
MTCSISIIVSEGSHENVRFVGFNNAPAECPTCHRLFPLATPKSQGGKRWAEFKCTRIDEHERNGEHWFEYGILKMSWTIDKDELWIA